MDRSGSILPSIKNLFAFSQRQGIRLVCFYCSGNKTSNYFRSAISAQIKPVAAFLMSLVHR